MIQFATRIASGAAKAGWVDVFFLRICLMSIMLLLPAAVAVDPIDLKLAFVLSEHTNIYDAAIKPFVDAVNVEGKGLRTIKVYPNGALREPMTSRVR